MGHVQLADAVLQIGTVVVQHPAALVAARKTSGFADLVVEQAAERVVEPPRNAILLALVQLDDHGVVSRSPSAVLEHEYVAELRERSQELAAGDRRRCGEGAGLWNAEKRIRHLRVQRAAQREILRVELIDVETAARTQVVAARPHVGDRNRHLARQLPLNVERVLLDAWRRAILVHVLNLTSDTGEEAKAVADRLLETVRKRVVQTQ